jgi:hypothetical protein
MRALKRSFKRLFHFTTNRRGDKRLREEIESHIATQAEANIRAGMGPEEARRQARLKFGPIEAVREDYHAEEGLPLFEDLLTRGNNGFCATTSEALKQDVSVSSFCDAQARVTIFVCWTKRLPAFAGLFNPVEKFKELLDRHGKMEI